METVTNAAKAPNASSEDLELKAPEIPELEIEISEVPDLPELDEAPHSEERLVPNLGFEDLTVNRYGYFQMPSWHWKTLTTIVSPFTVNNAVKIIAGLKEVDVRLDAALRLAGWEGFRPHMIGQLQTVWQNREVLPVLAWAANRTRFSWQEGYAAFPRNWGYGNLRHVAQATGPLGRLVELMDTMRPEGKTSTMNIVFLAKAAQLLGWV